MMNPEDFFKEQHAIEPAVELPYPDVTVPDYQCGTTGKWELEMNHAPIIRGYFQGVQVNPDPNYMLTKTTKGQRVIWMSLTPMEKESHMPHIAAARGHVLVIGLGMGMYLHNILAKPDVTKVTVIEKEKAVARLLRDRAGLDQWQGIEKLDRVVQGDCFNGYLRGTHFDHVYADIWDTLGAEEARADMVKIAELYSADSHSWWGMELDFVEFCTAGRDRGDKLQADEMPDKAAEWAIASQSHGVGVARIIMQDDWPENALRAATNVTLY